MNEIKSFNYPYASAQGIRSCLFSKISMNNFSRFLTQSHDQIVYASYQYNSINVKATWFIFNHRTGVVQ